MALTVTSNTTSVLTMNNTTDGGGTWTKLGGAGNPAQDQDIYADPTATAGSVNAKISSTRGGFQITTSTSYDFDDAGTRKGMIAFWASTQSNLSDTTDTGGITLRIGTSATVWEEWQVATKTGAGGVLAYPGGFQRFVVDLTTSPNTSSGSPNYAAINYWGIQFDITNTVSGNIKNCWIDRLDILTAADIVAGTAACTVTGTTTATSLFGEIADHTNNIPQAFISRVGGVYGLNQPIQLGTTTGINTFTSKNENCVWQAHKVNSGFFFINCIGGSGTDTFTFGTKSGSGSSAVGIDPTTITSAIPRWSLTAAETDIDVFQVYGATFSKMTSCAFGTSSTALGTNSAGYEFGAISTTLSDLSGQLTLNIASQTREENANRIITSTNSTGSLNLVDSTTIDVSDWQIVNSPGFENTGSAGTRTVTGHSFINAATNKPYVHITDSASAIWNLNNPNNGAAGRPSVTDQTELAFDGNNGTVNENYVVTWSVKTPSGTAINTAKPKILESVSSVYGVANQSSTDTNGDATSTYLRSLNVPSGANTLTITTHEPAAFKVFKYGYLPSISTATINQPVTNNIAMLADTFQVEAVEATAVSDGTLKVVIVEATSLAQSHSIIKVTSISGTNFATGDILTGGTSGASGTIEEIIEGSGVIGDNATIILKSRNSTSFSGTEAVNRTGGGSSTLVSSSEKRFYWLVQAGTISGTARTLQQLYDHFQAKLNEATLDSADNWDDIFMDGRAEFGTPIQGVSLGSPNSFKTIRNVALTHGYVISGLLSLSGLNSYTANDGTTFAPASSVNITITVKDESNNNVQSARVAIYRNSDSVELINGLTDSNGQVATTYIYTSDVPVTIRVRKSSATPKYISVNTGGTIGSTGLSATITFVAETIANSTTSGTIAGDFTINTTTKTIRHIIGETPIYSAKELYTWLMDYFDDSGLMDDTIPMTAQTPTEFTLVNGWFMDDTSMQFINGGAIQTSGWTHPTNTTGIRILTLATITGVDDTDLGTAVAGVTTGDTGKLVDYNTTLKKLWVRTDAADDDFNNTGETINVNGSGAGSMNGTAGSSVTGETIWSNIFSLGTLVSGTTLDVYQNDVQITPWWSSGQFDILVKVKEASVEIDSGNLTVLARKYSTLYDHFVIDASAGRNPVPLAAFNDTNNQTAEGTVGASPYTNITITFGHYSYDLSNGNGARDYDVEVNCATLTIAQVYEYLKYVTRTGSGSTLNGVNGEYYTAVGDIRLDYTGETSGPFVQGNAITSSAGGSGYIVSLIDNGATGTLVIRNVHGTFADTNTLTSAGTTATINGTPDSITQSKQAPFGTFAGGKLYAARGVKLYNMAAADATDYVLIDSTGTTQNPPISVSVELTNVVVGSQCLIYETANIANVILSETAATSTVSTTYTWGGNLGITIRVRKGTTAPKYLPYQATGIIYNTGFALSINQIDDDIAEIA